jgi:hypothetical protein
MKDEFVRGVSACVCILLHYWEYGHAMLLLHENGITEKELIQNADSDRIETITNWLVYNEETKTWEKREAK